MNEPRVTYLSAAITLADLLAPGEHRIFVAQGTGYSVHLDYTWQGICVYVTDTDGWDQSFETFTGNPQHQRPTWEHATGLLAEVFETHADLAVAA
jgi:hypothetical protein